MKKENFDLWQAIATFKLDDSEAARPFSTKLAEENKWTIDFTQRVIAEYKKFVFLCVTLPSGASPSETVDKAWHLHLTYTESYWNRFCPQVLGKPLHHLPSKGGETEYQKHQNWYQQTLMEYVKTFEQMPPDDIWTIPFGFDPSQYLPENSPFLLPHTDLSRDNREGGHFENQPDVFENNRLLEQIIYILIAVLLVVLFFPAMLKGIAFLLPFAALGISIAVALNLFHSNHNYLTDKYLEQISDKISPYIAALATGGNTRLMTTLLFAATDKCTFQNETQTVLFDLKKGEDLYKNPIYTALQTVEKSEVSTHFISDTVRPYWTLIQQQVQSKGYQSPVLPSKIVVFICLFFLIGIVRLCEGLFFHKPIGFLLFTNIGFALLLLVINNSSALSLQNWLERLTYRCQSATTQNQDPIWSFALGMLVFTTDAHWNDFENKLKPVHVSSSSDGWSDSSGCSSDGGDGGGGCGSGCGGCGGGD